MRPIGRRPFLAGALGAGLASSLSVPALARGARTPALRAFILGVDQYDWLDPLRRAVADADRVAQAVEACGYKVTKVNNADHAAVMASFEAYLESFEEGDAAFLYFAGHGIQIAGEGFFLPSNADCRAQTQFEETAIALTYLLDELRFKEPSQAIAVVDACRNPLSSVDLPRRATGMSSFSAPDGFCLLFSAGSGQFALDRLSEDDREENGLFARYFAPNLKPDISVADLYFKTRTKVKEAAAKVSHSQVPAFYNQAGRLKLVPDSEGASSARSVSSDQAERCGVLLIESSTGQLAGPARDIAAMEEHFLSFGASVEVIRSPDAREVRLACEQFAGRDLDRIILFFSGQGGITLDDGMVVVRDGEEGRPVDLGYRGSPSSMLLLQDLYRFLRPQGEDTDFSAPPIYMFIDTCVSDYGFAVTSEATDSLLERLRRSEVSDVSVLYSGSLGQVSLDTYDNGLGGLATALLESFTPGKRMGEIASQTRRIVQQLDADYYLALLEKEDPLLVQELRKEAKTQSKFYSLLKLYGSDPSLGLTDKLQCPQLFADWDVTDSVPLPLS